MEARAHGPAQAAQVILDGVRAADPADGAVINDAHAAGLRPARRDRGHRGSSLERVRGRGAEIQLDVAPLLSGLTLVVGYLADQLARAEGVSRDEVIADVREAFTG